MIWQTRQRLSWTASRNFARRGSRTIHDRVPARAGVGVSGVLRAGAIRLSNTIGAAVTNRRVMESVEARIVIVCGLLLLGLAILFALFPKALVYPLIAVLGWIALALLYRGYQLTLQRK